MTIEFRHRMEAGVTEVKVGIMPGAGGTQRLVRAAGMDAPLETALMLERKAFLDKRKPAYEGI